MTQVYTDISHCIALTLTMLQWMESSRIGQIGASVTSHAGEGHSLEVVPVMVLFMVVRTVLAPGKRPRHATHKIAQVRD